MNDPHPNEERLPNLALYTMNGSSNMTPTAMAALNSGPPFTNKGLTSHPRQLDKNFQPTKEELEKQEMARLAREAAKKKR